MSFAHFAWAALLAACAAKEPETPTPRSGCSEGYRPVGSPGHDVTQLGLRCGSAEGLTALGALQQGEQASGDAVDVWALDAATPGLCYRILAAGDRDVADLDVALLDAEGNVISADVGRDRIPIVPPAGLFCPGDLGRYRVEVSVPQGHGRYALQIWAAPSRP